MTLLDFVVIAAVLLFAHFVPAIGFISATFVVVVALIIERLIRGERILPSKAV